MKGFEQGWGFGCGCLFFIIALFLLFSFLGSSSTTPDGASGAGSDFLAGSGSSARITLSQYNQLTTGMSYSQVAQILGSEGVENSRNEMAGYVTVAYSWQNSDGSNIIVMFQNDALVQKSQADLQ